MPTDPLSQALIGARVLLFDFDGPLCDVFAGLPAPQVANELARLLSAEDGAAGAKAMGTTDPIEVLSIAHEADAALGQRIEQALTAAEVRAVEVAGAPTPGSVAALLAAKESNRGIAVVSNNSAQCVRAFLDRHGLGGYVTEIVGRPSEQPHLMKPNPYPLIHAAELMHVDVSVCALIGDSVTDIQAARAAGASVIGYANKPTKAETFASLGANAITHEMQAIADALSAEQIS
ncbi:HAD family hydrolase [Streptomyces sp. NBC_01460]|uniref:HAD family hydrolase n=1 Tax=Streptomyces sp. NBC_01460 TaxID=2903875 RepID=UPI002E3560D1|nr:HAD family hydrolase [Streptomyces sp. NBC_01460]